MTLSELRAQVGNLIGDTTDDRWSVQNKNDAIMRAYRKMVARVRLPSLYGNWTITVTGGTASYAFTTAVIVSPTPTSAKMKVLKKVYWGDKKPENRLTPLSESMQAQLDLTVTSDKPTNYYIQNKNIILYPAPTGSGTVKIEAWMIPLVLADGDSPLIPDDFHDYIPFGAAYRLLLNDLDVDNLSIAREYKDEFNAGLEEIITFHEEMGMEDDRPDQVLDSDDNFDDGFGYTS